MTRRKRRAAGWLGLMAAGLLTAAAAPGAQEAPAPKEVPAAKEAPAASGAPVVYHAVLDGIIHPVTAEFLIGTIHAADAAGAALTVITLRTPGGLVDSTLEINQAILAAKTPVVIYIAPPGSRAASAGFLIAMAADVLAMAPGTHIGAAHPVGGEGQSLDETMAKKAAEDVAAQARSLAEGRGRNVKLAEAAVFESKSYTDEEAVRATPPLADLIAPDFDTLLKDLDGRTIRRFNGHEETLHLAGARIVDVEMSLRQRLLSAIAHPQVAYLLFSLGTLGLVVELWSPGAILPGVAGGLCLLLAFFAFQILPVNYVGLALIAFGLLLLVLEIKVTSYGLLGVGGVTSLVFGSLMLFASPMPGMRLDLTIVLPVTLGISAILLFLVRLAVRSQRLRATTGDAGMIDEVGTALSAIEPGVPGRVSVHGEIWTALADELVAAGDDVQVTAVRGLKLTVRRVRPASAPADPQGGA